MLCIYVNSELLILAQVVIYSIILDGIIWILIHPGYYRNELKHYCNLREKNFDPHNNIHDILLPRLQRHLDNVITRPSLSLVEGWSKQAKSVTEKDKYLIYLWQRPEWPRDLQIGQSYFNPRENSGTTFYINEVLNFFTHLKVLF